VTTMPPDDQDPEDIDARYRRLSAADTARPHGAVSAAVLANAARLADERASAVRSGRESRALHRWRAPLFGGISAAALVGFLIIPRFTSSDRARPSAPPLPAVQRASPVAAASAPALASAPTAATAAATRPQQQQPVARFAAGRPSTDAARELSTDRGKALRQSADAGDLPGLTAVLDEKVSIDSRDSAGRTALMLAVLAGRDAVVGALLARGADPNAADAYGETPLQAAIAANRTEIAQALRRAGAH
jgi:Ankyrin repeats (many copies)